MIDATRRFARMGADVMRWQYCAQPPSQNLLFGFGPARRSSGRLLTLWNRSRSSSSTPTSPAFTPRSATLDGVGTTSSAARPVAGRAHRGSWSREVTDAYEQYLTVNVLRAFEAFVDDLSNWYIRRSRRRFWDGDEAALRTLWHALVAALRVVAPIMPFLTEHLWQVLVRDALPGRARPSSSPAGPAAGAPDDDAARRGRRRAPARRRSAARPAPSRLKNRQPLRRLVVEGARRRVAPRRDRRRAAREGGRSARWRPPSCGCGRTFPCSGRASGPSSALSAPRSRPVSSRSSTAAGSASPGTSSRPTRCSWSAPRRRAGRWPPPTGVTVALDIELDDELGARARLRPHPPREHPPQGAGPRAHGPHRPAAPGPRRRPARARRLDRARRWRSASRPTPSNHRRFGRPELLVLGELQLAAQLDRQAERDVLADVEPIRLDVVDPLGVEPVDDPDDQPLGS